ncbi:coronin-7-like isoform 1-T1 [Vipera latastei]
MSRFRVSKFRHVEAKVARKEAWIGDLQSSCPAGNPHIKANSLWIAFSTHLAGMLGTVPLESPKGIKRVISHLHCHSDVVTDFDFSPFDQQLLATGSADKAVKVWRLLEADQDLSASPHVMLGLQESQVEVLLFHPTADGVLASAAGKAVKIWDVEQRQILIELEPHLNQVQSLAWKPDGSLLGSSCRDKRLHIFDPRAKPVACQTVLAHAGGREAQLLWVNAEGFFLSVGSNQMMEREVCLWDSRRLSSSLASLTLDASPRPLIPLFDPSTGLLVLAGKGEKVLFCYEVQPAQLAVTQGEFPPQLACPEAPGVGVPLPAHSALLSSPELSGDPEPRGGPAAQAGPGCQSLRSDEGFAAERLSHCAHQLPGAQKDCPGNVPAASAQAWWAGDNTQVETVSLDPTHRPSPGFLSACLPHLDKDRRHPPSTHMEAGDQAKDLEISVGSRLSSPGSCLASPSSAAPSLSATSGFSCSPSQRSLQNILGPSSAFRHIEGIILPRSTHITNLRGLSLTTPGECDGFCANRHHIAIPLLATGGQVAILELSQPGRLPDTPMPTIQNGAPVSDLCWDPFDEQRLAIAGEDTKIRLWRVEPTGLQKQLLEPEVVLRGHTEKIYSVKFHPLASDILASSSYDKSVRIWDVRTGRQELGLHGHIDQIFSLAWSPDGCCLATASKDGKVRVYEPRQAAQPLQDGPGPKGGRGARVVWVCGGKYLLVSGFDSRSERQLSLHQAEALAAGPLATISLDISPSILIPFYDMDTSVAFFTGKGDTRVFVYEVAPEAPFFLECNSFLSCDPHKGFHFLPKTACDVREVEIARALRLRQTSIEPVAFRVPRVKKEFFQDDLFPATQVWWEPALPGTAWLKGANKQHQTVSLKPKDMAPVSQAPKEAPSQKYLPSSVYLEEKSDEQKKEELLSAIAAKLGNRDDPLPQDSFEGVDEEEWD